jgi:hypothetical protein
MKDQVLDKIREAAKNYEEITLDLIERIMRPKFEQTVISTIYNVTLLMEIEMEPQLRNKFIKEIK